MKPWQLLVPVVWGVGLPLSARLFPTVGPAVLWGTLATYLTVGAVIVWFRTGLRWFALSGIVGASTAAFAGTRPMAPDWHSTDYLIYLGGFAATMLCAFIQSRADPRGWTELRSSMTSGNVGFMDALLLRPIPNLRTPRTE